MHRLSHIRLSDLSETWGVNVLAGLAAPSPDGGVIVMGWDSIYKYDVSGRLHTKSKRSVVPPFISSPSGSYFACGDRRVLRLDRNLDSLWATVNGDLFRPKKLLSDRADNLYVIGNYGSGNGIDICVVKYDSNGVAKWSKRYDGPAKLNDSVYDAIIDERGNIYVVGKTQLESGRYVRLIFKISQDYPEGVVETATRAEPSLRLYPNPASGYVIIEASSGVHYPCSVRVTDDLGRIVMERKFLTASTKRLGVATLLAGVYLVELVDAEGTTFVQRITILR